ncbi:hypothetical protein [Pseudomonas cichorii]|uniref:Uncharacterized protein n=1 Tax=Pseudomonas cichorii TaxID=36746 RepID=A0ABQ1DT17_PSECI|nr:hypothetical protein [Pseudomonas cichorii]QVE17982.1 hypothetical protein KGD89_04275 [Pseudomonas cichorii]GFM94165.1 hypothetical protein PSCICP_41370 [Pseudomonas cichorii]SDP00243.1 hypothetical protein SAMN05216599_116128 [Pseudomonas cichorii]
MSTTKPPKISASISENHIAALSNTFAFMRNAGEFVQAVSVLLEAGADGDSDIPMSELVISGLAKGMAIVGDQIHERINKAEAFVAGSIQGGAQ